MLTDLAFLSYRYTTSCPNQVVSTDIIASSHHPHSYFHFVLFHSHSHPHLSCPTRKRPLLRLLLPRRSHVQLLRLIAQNIRSDLNRSADFDIYLDPRLQPISSMSRLKDSSDYPSKAQAYWICVSKATSSSKRALVPCTINLSKESKFPKVCNPSHCLIPDSDCIYHFCSSQDSLSQPVSQ